MAACDADKLWAPYLKSLCSWASFVVEYKMYRANSGAANLWDCLSPVVKDVLGSLGLSFEGVKDEDTFLWMGKFFCGDLELEEFEEWRDSRKNRALGIAGIFSPVGAVLPEVQPAGVAPLVVLPVRPELLASLNDDERPFAEEAVAPVFEEFFFAEADKVWSAESVSVPGEQPADCGLFAEMPMWWLLVPPLVAELLPVRVCAASVLKILRLPNFFFLMAEFWGRAPLRSLKRTLREGLGAGPPCPCCWVVTACVTGERCPDCSWCWMKTPGLLR